MGAMVESRYRWMIVAAGALMGCIALGAMFSLPVLLRPIVAGMGWSTTGVSAAMTVASPTVCDVPRTSSAVFCEVTVSGHALGQRVTVEPRTLPKPEIPRSF